MLSYALEKEEKKLAEQKMRLVIALKLYHTESGIWTMPSELILEPAALKV